MSELKQFLLERAQHVAKDLDGTWNDITNGQCIWSTILTDETPTIERVVHRPLISCPPSATGKRYQTGIEVSLLSLYSSIISDKCQTVLHKTPVGEYTLHEILETLIEIRKEQKKFFKQLLHTAPYEIAQEIEKNQLAAKVLINSLFGFIVHRNFEITCHDIVDEGRSRMVEVYQLLRRFGYTVVYIDTDQMFIADGNLKMVDDILKQHCQYRYYCEKVDVSLSKFKKYVVGGKPRGFIPWDIEKKNTKRDKEVIDNLVNDDIINQLRGGKAKL